VESRRCTAPWHLFRVITEAIVHLALFRVREHLESFRDLLEPFFGRFVPWIHIGVVLSSQTAIGLLDVISFSAARNAKHFVVIVSWHRKSASRTNAGGRTRRRENSLAPKPGCPSYTGRHFRGVKVNAFLIGCIVISCRQRRR